MITHKMYISCFLVRFRCVKDMKDLTIPNQIGNWFCTPIIFKICLKTIVFICVLSINGNYVFLIEKQALMGLSLLVNMYNIYFLTVFFWNLNWCIKNPVLFGPYMEIKPFCRDIRFYVHVYIFKSCMHLYQSEN